MNRYEGETDKTIELSLVFISTESSLADVTVTGWDNHILEATQDFSNDLAPSFTLTVDSKTTSSLTRDVSTEELTDALYSLYSIQCETTSAGNLYFKDSFDIVVQSTYNLGSLDSSVEPYCGRISLRNPRNVFYSDVIIDELTGNHISPVTITDFGFRYVSQIFHYNIICKIIHYILPFRLVLHFMECYQTQD